MTTSILKQDPNTLKVLYFDKSQPANFQGNPFLQATNNT